jgi:hypothetical protein
VLANDSASGQRNFTKTARLKAGQSAQYGTLTLNDNGNYTYTPTAGTLDQFRASGGENIAYEEVVTYTDDNNNLVTLTSESTLKIKPGILHPSQATSAANITVTNGGPDITNGVGSVYVWFSGNSVSINPATGSDFCLSVANSNPTASTASVTWSGDADYLVLSVNGTLNDISISGNANVSANTLGDVTATTIRASAYDAMGDITASDRVFSASAWGSSMGTYSGDIASVTAINDIYSVSAGHDVGPVTSSSGNIARVYAGHNVGSATASEDIGLLSAGNDITGAVTSSNGDVGFSVLSAYTSTPYGSATYGSIGGAFAGHSVTGNVSAPSGNVSVVHAETGDVSGSVNAGNGTVYFVTSTQGAITGAVTASNSIGKVSAKTNVTGAVTGTAGYIGVVNAGQDIQGAITAGTGIGQITAGRYITGSIEAKGCSIYAVSAGTATQADGKQYGRIEGSKISASQSILSITCSASADCGGSIQPGVIEAKNGFIGSITAAGSLASSVSAKLSIGAVVAGSVNEGNISGSLKTTNGPIRSIESQKGGISAEVEAKTANGNIGSVTARDAISGTITAEGIVGNVTSQRSNIGAVSGKLGVGNILAGIDVTGNIASESGSVGDVTAGNYKPGNISGGISAASCIGTVRAIGEVTGDTKAIDQGGFSSFFNQLLAWIAGDDPDPDTMPDAPSPTSPVVKKGDITGVIHAGGNIKTITADGHITSKIDAVGELPSVTAKGDIRGDVSSGSGSMTIQAGGNTAGKLSAANSIAVSAGDSVTGNVTALSGVAMVSAGGQITGEILGQQGVNVMAWGNVSSPTIRSASGYVGVTSCGTVKSIIDSQKTAGLCALHNFNGQMTSHNGSAVIGAFGSVKADVKAKANGIVAAIGSIGGSINVLDAMLRTGSNLNADITSYKDIVALAKNQITGSMTCAGGNIYASAADINCKSIVATGGQVGLDVYGSLTAKDVRGVNGIAARVRGTANAGFDTVNGDLLISADGAIGGTLKASGDIVAISWDAINTTEITSTQGSVDVFAYGQIDGKTTAKKDAIVSTWNSMNATVSADRNAVVIARQNVTKRVTAAKSALVIAGGSISGDIIADSRSVDMTAVATAIAHESIQANVSGAASATADALGSVKGNVTASSGDVLVSALDGYEGNVSAATDTAVISGGKVTSHVLAKGSAAVVAHGEISSFTCTAGANAVIRADGNFNGTVSAGGSASVSSLKALTSANVTAKGDIRLFAGETAKLAAASFGGSVTAISIGKVEGSVSAARDATVSTWDNAQSVAVSALTGSATLFAGGSIQSATTANAAVALSVSAMGSVHGTFTSQGIASVFCGTDLDATVGGVQSVSVFANGEIKGTVTSAQADASALSVTGSLDANTTVTAGRNASVGLLAGTLNGSVAATQGDADVSACGSIVGNVSAGRDATVWTLASVLADASVTAKGNASVTAFGSVSANVAATGGSASVFAGTQITGNVIGHVDATAYAAVGQISGNVTAQVADATAVAGGQITGNVSGQENATSVSLDRISGNVTATAGDATAVARGGIISGYVTAGANATAIALKSISGPVHAEADALAASLDSVTGTVTAGRDAVVMAGSAVGGHVDAHRDAVVVAYDAVDGGVDAASGDAVVLTWGAVSGGVHGGDSAFVWAGGSVSGLVGSEGDVAVIVVGSSTATLSAGKVAFLYTAGVSSGSVSATDDVVVISLSSSQVVVSAGDDAVVATMGSYQGNVTAAGDAYVESLGTVTGGVIAGGDAMIWAADSVIGSVDAEGYAAVVTWGAGVGPLVVDGDDGAFAFVYRDFNGDVRSAHGDAALVAYGTAVGNVTSGGDALAVVVGDWVGRITADGTAGAVVLGNFDGSMAAGSDGFILGEGSVHGSLTAGRDAYVWAIGNVAGNYHAGRDASLMTYGSYSASLSATRNVGYVWARGDLVGSVSAGGNIGYGPGSYYSTPSDYAVFSYGEIMAVLSAPNGRIGSVGAWNDIEGQIRAGQSIGTIHAGGDVEATIVCPQTGPVVENDTALQTSHPRPDTPESVKDEVLTTAATVYDEVVATKADLAADIEETLEQLAVDHAQALADRKTAVSKAEAANQAQKVEQANEFVKAWLAATAELDRLAKEASDSVTAVKAESTAAKKAIAEELKVVVAAQNTARQTAVDDKAKEAAQLAKSDEEMAAEKKDFLDKSAGEKADWPEKCRELYKAFYKAQYAALQAQYNETGSSKIPFWGKLWNAYYEYQQEHYLKAAGYLGLAALDAWGVFAIAKGAFAAGRYAASRASSTIAGRTAASAEVEAVASAAAGRAAPVESASLRWGPTNGAGPLGEQVANTFRGGSYTQTVLNGETTLYRSYGGSAGQLGSYWTRTAPTGPLQATMDSALNPAWGNTAQNVVTIRVPAGTTIYEGFAAPQGNLLGGGSQVYIPKVNPGWIVPK